MVKTFKANITYLIKQGFKPVSNIIDNVASKGVQKYLKEEQVGIQRVELHKHRVMRLNAPSKHSRTYFCQD